MSDQSQINSAGKSSASWTPRQIAFLKKAVAVMSVILVAGMAVIAGRIVYLAQQSDAAKAPALAIAMRQAVNLALPAGAAIRSVALDGAHLAVHYDAAGGGGVAILDLSSGRVVSRVSVSATQKAQ